MGKTSYTELTMAIRVVGADEQSVINAGIADHNSLIITLLVDNPLTAGTRIIMNANSSNRSLGEVVDWEWDYRGVYARVHVKRIGDYGELL